MRASESRSVSIDRAEGGGGRGGGEEEGEGEGEEGERDPHIAFAALGCSVERGEANGGLRVDVGTCVREPG